MSLNDSQWGRRPDDKKENDARQDNRDEAKPDTEREPEMREPRAEDRVPGLEDRPRVSRDDRDMDRESPRSPRTPRQDNSNNPESNDIDELWERLTKLFGGESEDEPRRRQDSKSKLLSRDDFSRGEGNARGRDEERSSRSRRDERDDDDTSKGITFEFPRFGKKRSSNDEAEPANFGGGHHNGNDNLRRGGSIGVAIAIVALIGWATTGFYIVPEGQVGVVTTFGKYSSTTNPGFRWHMPTPVQDVQLVDVSSVRTIDIGGAGKWRESLMLTDDENIVDMSFSVQYRILPGGAKDYVFNLRSPDQTVKQVAESAMREVVGRRTMDSVLFESKAEIANAVRQSMQAMLNRYHSGIEVMSVAIQNAQPPEPVQAAFNDAVKAGQDRERQINLGEAYRNAILPKAQGTASRVKQEALGYQARVEEAATGDAQRFTSLYNQYKLAPQVTRDRMYVDAVKDVLKNVTKVYVDQKSGSNLLYLPLDKIMGAVKADAQKAAQADANETANEAAADSTPMNSSVPSTTSTNTNAVPTLEVDPFARRGLLGRTR